MTNHRRSHVTSKVQVQFLFTPFPHEGDSLSHSRGFLAGLQFCSAIHYMYTRPNIVDRTNNVLVNAQYSLNQPPSNYHTKTPNIMSVVWSDLRQTTYTINPRKRMCSIIRYIHGVDSVRRSLIT
jgi:hypothetical protein